MESANILPQLRGDTAPRMLLTAREAARVLAISPRTLWSHTKTGQIPAVRIGRSVRYAVTDLQAWIDRCKTGSSTPEVGTEA